MSDDEDLQDAYELAKNSMKGHINFFVKSIDNDETAGEEDKPFDFTVFMPQEHRERFLANGKTREPKPKKVKEVTQAYQRRAFKKLIKKELNKQCDQIFNEVYNSP